MSDESDEKSVYELTEIDDLMQQAFKMFSTLVPSREEGTAKVVSFSIRVVMGIIRRFNFNSIQAAELATSVLTSVFATTLRSMIKSGAASELEIAAFRRSLINALDAQVIPYIRRYKGE